MDGYAPNFNHMVQLGFQDWQSIDRSYDLLVDPALRFSAAFDEVIKQARAIDADPLQWLTNTRESSISNIRHAFSGTMLARYVSLYDVPIVNRLCRLVGK